MPRAKKTAETPEANRAAVDEAETRDEGRIAAPSKPKSKGSDRVAAVSYDRNGEPDQSADFTVLGDE